MSETPMSPRMRRLLERAAEIAEERTGTRFIGTESVLRAMADDEDAIAAQVLRELGVLERVRARLDQIMSSAEYAKGSNRIFPSASG
jgi:ATP-dependent Clp protease ATP-binding subunit ClpA